MGGTVAFSTRLKSGDSYAITVTTEPSAPVELCSIVNGSGTIQNTDVTLSVVCTTDGAAQTSTVVSIDPNLPSATTSGIAQVVTPVDSGALGSSLKIATVGSPGETMVMALNANGDILLAALVTDYQTQLSADSTALALTRVLIGPLDPTASTSAINAQIRSTNEYANLVTLISTLVGGGSAPSSSNAVFQSMNSVIAQLYGSLNPSHSAANAARKIKSLASPSVPKAPYTLLSWSGANTALQSIQLVGITGSGDAVVTNGTSIAWSASATSTDTGAPFCAPGPDGGCETVLTAASLFKQLAIVTGTVPVSYTQVEVPATNTAYNFTLQQTALSEVTNTVQVAKDFAQFGVSITLEGADPGKLVTCTSNLIDAALPASAVAAAILNQSPGALQTYIRSALKDAIFSTSGFATVAACIGPVPIQPNDGFFGALGAFVFNFGNFVANSSSQIAASAGFGFELGQFLYYIGPNFEPVAVGICLGTPPNGAFGIVDCAKSLTFNPSTLYMAPTATGSAPAITAVGTVTATTLVPTDLIWTIVPAVADIDQTANNITATASASSTPAVVTATSPSTSATGSFQVFVVDPILTPSALAVDTTSSAQTVTVALLGPNENPIVLPKNITWSAQLIKDSDSSSIPITPTTMAAGSATWTIPSETPSGMFDVTAFDPFGISYGFESVTVTNTGTGVRGGGQTFNYTGQPLTACSVGQLGPVPGALLATVTLAAPIPSGFTGSLFSDGISSGNNSGNYVAALTLSSNGVGSSTQNFNNPALGVLLDGAVPYVSVSFLNGEIQQWLIEWPEDLLLGIAFAGFPDSSLASEGGQSPIIGIAAYGDSVSIGGVGCGQSSTVGTWSP
jgi:hypothetical protein